MMQTNYIIRSQSRSASHVTKIWKRVAPEPERSAGPGPAVETPGACLRVKHGAGSERSRRVPDWQAQLEEVEAELQAMEHSGIIRPPWAPGLTNAELLAIAAHEQLNPYRYDWWDGIDSLIIRQAKSGGFKRNVRHALTELKAERTRLRRELSWSR